jgi:peptidoglycan-associated lipoprotein
MRKYLMQKSNIVNLLLIGTCTLALTSCARSRDDVWDDTKTATRHVSRGIASLGGKHGDSRQIRSRDEFIRFDDNSWAYEEDTSEVDFVPLEEECTEVAMVDIPRPQARRSPGDPKSAIPGIEAFKDPSLNSEWKVVFDTVLFPYNSNLIKGDENLNKVQTMAHYLKRNSDIYVFIEGHCDQRGAEAYNLSLGSKRANSIRDQLIKEGVSPEQLFSVSYGKEKPKVKGNDEAAWKKNRRAEFKIYRQA